MIRSSSNLLVSILFCISAGLVPACSGDAGEMIGAMDSGEDSLVSGRTYAVPENAVFVAVTGDDGATGTQGSPLKTVAAGLAKVPAGGTLVLRGGTYREGKLKINKKVTLQRFGSERVSLKGSDVVTGWRVEGGAWVHDDWNPSITHVTGDAIDPARSEAGLTDAVVVNGRPLQQVLSRAALREGTFFVDAAQNKLVLGANPSGKRVEATVHNVGIIVNDNATGTKLLGLHFAHYAQTGVDFMPDDGLIENAKFYLMGVDGALLHGANRTVVRDCRFARNGRKGLGVHESDGVVVEHSAFALNNFEGFRESYGAAGLKAVATTGLVVRDSLFERNHGNGLWMDGSAYDTQSYRNTLMDNEGFGIFYELSHRGVVASNVIVRSRLPGIALADTSNVRVFNNTVVDSGQSGGIFMKDSDRVNQFKPDGRRSQATIDEERAKGILWSTHGNVVRNNLLVYSAEAKPFITAGQCEQSMLSELDHNGYARPPGGRNVAFNWYAASGAGCGKNTSFDSLAAFRSVVGKDLNSDDHGTATAASFFVDANAGDYRLKGSSPAKGKGGPLPEEVARMIGVQQSTGGVDQGALVFTPDMASLRVTE